MYYRMKTSDYRICSKCGKGFSTTFDCKTTMCPECYAKYRKEYKRKKALELYYRKKNIIGETNGSENK